MEDPKSSATRASAKMKNYGNTVILNPFAQLSEEKMHLPHTLLLTDEERKRILTTYDKASKSLQKKGKASDSPMKAESTSKPAPKSDSDEVPEEGETQKIKNSEAHQQKSHLPPKSDSQDELSDSKTEFAQNYKKLLEIYESVKGDRNLDKELEGSNIQWSNLEYTDKVIAVNKSQLKVITRDRQGKLDISASMMMTYCDQDGKHLILTKQDMI